VYVTKMTLAMDLHQTKSTPEEQNKGFLCISLLVPRGNTKTPMGAVSPQSTKAGCLSGQCVATRVRVRIQNDTTFTEVEDGSDNLPGALLGCNGSCYPSCRPSSNGSMRKLLWFLVMRFDSSWRHAAGASSPAVSFGESV
jgi:hypothetical protein